MDLLGPRFTCSTDVGDGTLAIVIVVEVFVRNQANQAQQRRLERQLRHGGKQGVIGQEARQQILAVQTGRPDPGQVVQAEKIKRQILDPVPKSARRVAQHTGRRVADARHVNRGTSRRYGLGDQPGRVGKVNQPRG